MPPLITLRPCLGVFRLLISRRESDTEREYFVLFLHRSRAWQTWLCPTRYFAPPGYFEAVSAAVFARA